MEWIIYLALVLIGVCLGSFAGATVWRLRARELKQDKKDGQRINHEEYKRLSPLMSTKLSKDRSRCLHCSHVLKWHDLIPVVSWISLGGKCRYCKKGIGYFEPLVELGVAAFFVISYALWPFELSDGLQIARFLIWLAAGVAFAILFAYDKKWFLLPDKVNFTLIGLGVATVIITALQSGNVAGTLFTALGAVATLSGLYLVLHLISKGKWIGLGDVKLGLGLALLLVDWQLAVVALFLANFIGCLIVIPLLATKKLKRNSRVPFGPLLIGGTILAQLIGPAIVALYLNSLI